MELENRPNVISIFPRYCVAVVIYTIELKDMFSNFPGVFACVASESSCST